MKIEVYSDGSATTGNKPGGWGSVIVIDGTLHKELSGHLENATNNDAELQAAIQGLWYVAEHIPTTFADSVELISDSEIILNWANGKYRFKQESKMMHYEQLRMHMLDLKVKTRWVKGHSGDKWNERCDKLANLARKKDIETLDNFSPAVHTRIGTKKNDILCIWHGDVLKVIDLENNLVEDYNRDAHGKRGSALEIRGEKDR